MRNVKATRLFKKGGRPPKNPPPGWQRETYTQTKMIKRNVFPSPQAVSRELNRLRPAGGQSSSTVRRDVHSAIGGAPLLCFRQQKRSELTAEQKAARLKFCREVVKKGLLYACSILFSDEKWFDSNDHRHGYQYAKSRSEVREVRNDQHPPKVFVWAMIGVGIKKLVTIVGFADESGATPGLRWEQYVKECLQPHIAVLQDPERTFMQDGAGCHKKALAWIRQRKVKLVQWPSGSADLNPLENLWDWLAKQVSERGPWGPEELAKFVQEEWKKMTQGHVDTYVLSFMQRCEQCIERNGGHVDS